MLRAEVSSGLRGFNGCKKVRAASLILSVIAMPAAQADGVDAELIGAREVGRPLTHETSAARITGEAIALKNWVGFISSELERC
jgi:hypothetical protein